MGTEYIKREIPRLHTGSRGIHFLGEEAWTQDLGLLAVGTEAPLLLELGLLEEVNLPERPIGLSQLFLGASDLGQREAHQEEHEDGAPVVVLHHPPFAHQPHASHPPMVTPRVRFRSTKTSFFIPRIIFGSFQALKLVSQ